MGVIKRGILGGFSGKVANVVGSSWKGIAYMKSMPLSVANPQTAGQTTQRNAFTEVVRSATSSLATFIKPLWDRFAQGMSGYNDYVSKNIEFFPDGVLTTPADLKASVGTLYNPGLDQGQADASAGTIIIETLGNSNGSNGATTDEVYLLWRNATQDYWKGQKSTNTRTEQSMNFTDADLVAGDTLTCWLAFRKTDGTLVSNSAYIALTVIA